MSRLDSDDTIVVNIFFRHYQIMSHLKIRPSFLNFNRLIHAAHNGNVDNVRSLLESPNVSPGAKDGNGRTALMSAAANGHAEIVDLILQSPKSTAEMVSDKDENGATALMFAAADGYDKIVDLILQSPKSTAEMRMEQRL